MPITLYHALLVLMNSILRIFLPLRPLCKEVAVERIASLFSTTRTLRLCLDRIFLSFRASIAADFLVAFFE